MADEGVDTLAESPFSPVHWALASIAVWLAYVGLKGWHACGVWERREVAFGVFSALLLMNFLSLDEQFKGWADVYYFCGRQLQYCTCNFRWNVRGWAKAYILWSFVLSSASGLQRLLLQIGLNGLLPGEEVVTRESIVSICWRLIPYWLNNWEQQWGAECSSMMFELPHFAVELLVILPCIQILCARLKILAMPIVHVADMAQEPPALPAAGDAPQPAAPVAGRRGRRAVLVRDDFAPNILRGYWERRPEQRRLLPRLRANLQVMSFTAFVTALAACNALLVPLMLESSIASHPATHAIQIAGRYPDWFTSQGLNSSAINTSLITPSDVALLNDRFSAFQAPRQPLLSSGHHLLQLQSLWQQPAAAASQGGAAGPAAAAAAGGSSATSVVVQALGSTIGKNRVSQVLHALGRQLTVAPLRAAIADRSLLGFINALLGTEVWEAVFGSAAGAAGPQARGAVATAARRAAAARAARAAAASAAADTNTTTHTTGTPTHTATVSTASTAVPMDSMDRTATRHNNVPSAVSTSSVSVPSAVSVSVSGVSQVDSSSASVGVGEGWCGEHLASFKSNIAKHAEEISKMQAPEHRSLIPLVESALAVMRLSCEKYFVLLSVYVAHLLYRERLPRHVRVFIRINARLSTAFQKVILYSFPAVCWVYGAGVLFSLFVSAVFWGAPIMSAYDSLRNAISTVRIQSLRRATEAELERMGGNCTICWGDMHVNDTQHSHTAAPAPTQPTPTPTAAATTGTTAAADASTVAGERAAVAGVGVAAGGVADGVAQGPGGGVGVGVGAAAGHTAPAVGASAGVGDNNTADGPNSHSNSGDGGGTSSLGEEARAWSLPCGHAYHYACLTQWLMQCHSNGTTPTCPMCQAAIRLEVKWRFPWPWNARNSNNMAGGMGHAGGPGGAAHAAAPHAPAPGGELLLPPAADGGAAGAAGGVDERDSDNELDDDGLAGHDDTDSDAGTDDDGRDNDHIGGHQARNGGDEGGRGDGRVELLAVPVMNGGGALGRQRGRVRAAGGARAHENLLLPPPMAALGGMNMLRLLDHQRELQELLQDMPQIPLPDDVAALQLVAQGHDPAAAAGGAAIADLPPLPALAAAAARPADDRPGGGVAAAAQGGDQWRAVLAHQNALAAAEARARRRQGDNAQPPVQPPQQAANQQPQQQGRGQRHQRRGRGGNAAAQPAQPWTPPHDTNNPQAADPNHRPITNHTLGREDADLGDLTLQQGVGAAGTSHGLGSAGVAAEGSAGPAGAAGAAARQALQSHVSQQTLLRRHPYQRPAGALGALTSDRHTNDIQQQQQAAGAGRPPRMVNQWPCVDGQLVGPSQQGRAAVAAPAAAAGQQGLRRLAMAPVDWEEDDRQPLPRSAGPVARSGAANGTAAGDFPWPDAGAAAAAAAAARRSLDAATGAAAAAAAAAARSSTKNKPRATATASATQAGTNYASTSATSLAGPSGGNPDHDAAAAGAAGSHRNGGSSSTVNGSSNGSSGTGSGGKGRRGGGFLRVGRRNKNASQSSGGSSPADDIGRALGAGAAADWPELANGHHAAGGSGAGAAAAAAGENGHAGELPNAAAGGGGGGGDHAPQQGRRKFLFFLGKR